MEDTADPTKDLELARSFLSDPRGHSAEMADRLMIVARIVPILNRRNGAGLDGHEVADLVQDVTVTALRRLASFAGRGTLNAWLYALCEFELWNRYRRVRRHRQRERTGMVAVEPQASDPCPQDGESVHEVLARLGGYEADIIRMHALEGLEFSAIATALRLSVANVKTRYYRGLQRLQFAFGGARTRAEQA